MKTKKAFKQCIATALLIQLTLNTTLTANAETVLNAAGTASVTVSSNVTSTFEVRIPDSITLAEDGTKVPIYGSGDIGGDETLQITTGSTLVMSSSGKDDVTLNLSQDATDFTWEQVASTCTSNISISAIPEAMTSGNWVGTMNVNVNLVSSGESAEYAAKKALMRTLNLHIAGDSIMEGFKNNYRGVGDYVSADWGSTVATDYSLSGAYLTQYPNKNSSIYHSMLRIADKLNYGMTAKDVVIFDGGGNELLVYDEGGYDDITFNFSGGVTTDVLSAWAGSINGVLDVMEAQGVEAPIIFLLPYVPQTSMYETYRSKILSAAEKQINQGVDNVFIIDMKDLLQDSDYNSDKIHWNASAYEKISDKIADVLYDYYSS